MDKRIDRVDRYLGFTILAGLATGVVSFLVAIIAIVVNEWIGAGIALVAAALAFGLMAIAFLKD